ncbi:MAG: hypothetical protein ACI9SQ_001671, partial [Rubritalea sp.]
LTESNNPASNRRLQQHISRERVRKNSLKKLKTATVEAILPSFGVFHRVRLRFDCRTALRFGNRLPRMALNATKNPHWCNNPLRQNTESKSHH